MMADFTGTVVIIGDGGCSNNGAPNASAFGSFLALAKVDGATVKRHASGRLPYPQHATNNGAEIQVCIDALRFLLQGRERVTYPVLYQTDSQLVVNWLAGSWSVNADHLRPLVAEARQLAALFDDLSFQWVPRETVAAVLGH